MRFKSVGDCAVKFLLAVICSVGCGHGAFFQTSDYSLAVVVKVADSHAEIGSACVYKYPLVVRLDKRTVYVHKIRRNHRHSALAGKSEAHFKQKIVYTILYIYVIRALIVFYKKLFRVHLIYLSKIPSRLFA